MKSFSSIRSGALASCALLACAALLVHCSSPEEDPSTDTDPSEAGDASDEAEASDEDVGSGGTEGTSGFVGQAGGSATADDEKVCGIRPSALPAPVPATFSNEDAPEEFSGGTIPPGTYVLTEWIHYKNVRESLSPAEEMAAILVLDDTGEGRRILNWGEESFVSSFEWVGQSTYFGTTFTCPAELVGDSHADRYNMEGDRLILFNDNNRAQIYTREAQ